MPDPAPTLDLAALEARWQDWRRDQAAPSYLHWDELVATEELCQAVPALVARVRELAVDVDRLRSVLGLVAQFPVAIPILERSDPAAPPLTLQEVARAALHPSPWVPPAAEAADD